MLVKHTLACKEVSKEIKQQVHSSMAGKHIDTNSLSSSSRTAQKTAKRKAVDSPRPGQQVLCIDQTLSHCARFLHLCHMLNGNNG